MAKIGLQNLLFGILTETEGATPEASYGTATKPAKAVSCNVSINSSEAKLYADDGLAESDTSFQDGTITLTVDDEDLTTLATLLGHTISDGEIIRNASDAAPYVGIGRIVTKMVGGAYKYKVEFLSKVKFKEPSQEDNTKGESLVFGTTEIEGTIATLASGEWSKAKTFNTMDAAKSYLNGLFAAPVAATVTYNKNGATGNAPAAVSTYVGATITLNDGSGLTKSGYVFDGWDTSSSATSADLHTTLTVTGNTTLYAIFVTE